MSEKKVGFATRAIHDGQKPDELTGAVPPGRSINVRCSCPLARPAAATEGKLRVPYANGRGAGVLEFDFQLSVDET